MAAEKDYWEFSTNSDVICYRGIWKESRLSKDEFLSIMREVAKGDKSNPF